MLLLSLAGLVPTAALGQTLVWTDSNARKIQRKEVSGGAIQTILQLPSPHAPYQVHYDPVTAKLYYLRSLFSPDVAIRRINLDGSEDEIVPTPTAGPFILNVDSRKLYWGAVGTTTFYRAELNGTVVNSRTYPGCCLDPAEAFDDKLFLVGGGMVTKGLWRADPDLSNEQFLYPTSAPGDLAYDPVEGKIYGAGIEEIFKINLDGTGFEQLPLPPISPAQVVVDHKARKLYWGESFPRVIRRSNLDGSNAEDFVTAADLGNPNFAIAGLEIVYTYSAIPTVSGWGAVVMTVLMLIAGTVRLRNRLASREPVVCG